MTHKHIRSNQRARIFELLKSRAPEWVPAFELAAIALQYNARVHELRGAGHYIENRTKRLDGIQHSWFRLASRVPAARTEQTQPSPTPAPAAVQLFDSAGIPAQPDNFVECSRHELARQRGQAKGEGRG